MSSRLPTTAGICIAQSQMPSLNRGAEVTSCTALALSSTPETKWLPLNAPDAADSRSRCRDHTDHAEDLPSLPDPSRRTAGTHARGLGRMAIAATLDHSDRRS